MRRIILQPGEQFTNAHLKRTGAFNAQALTAATAIIEGVRERGDEALRAYTEQFDGVRVEEFRVSQAAIAEAIVNVDDKTARALRQAAAQIRDFHERQKQQSWFTVREDGALVGSKVEPLESVGIYVPGGRALYPSSVLMNALPAAVAGVKRIVCVTAADGRRNAGSGHFGGVPHLGRHRNLRGGRRAGHRRAGVRHRVHRARGQDHRTRQRLRGGGEEGGVGRCGHRHDRRPVRGVRRGRLHGRSGARGHRPHGAGRARPAGRLLPGYVRCGLRRRGGAHG